MVVEFTASIITGLKTCQTHRQRNRPGGDEGGIPRRGSERRSNLKRTGITADQEIPAIFLA
jgi:hypothetical protein